MLRVGVPALLVLGLIVLVVSTISSPLPAQYRTPTVTRTTTAAPRPTTNLPLISWEFDDWECSDGWRSSSIGVQGACSHHGGVVAVYTGSNGQRLACPRGDYRPPIIGQEQADERASATWSGTYWCLHT